MPWRFLSSFRMSNAWQYTQPFEGRYIRIQQSITPPSPSALRGVVAQGNTGVTPREIFEPNFIYSDYAYPVIEVNKPDDIWADRVVGIKGLYYVSEYNWRVTISYWDDGPGSGNASPQQTIETMLIYGAI